MNEKGTYKQFVINYKGFILIGIALGVMMYLSNKPAPTPETNNEDIIKVISGEFAKLSDNVSKQITEFANKEKIDIENYKKEIERLKEFDLTVKEAELLR